MTRSGYLVELMILFTVLLVGCTSDNILFKEEARPATSSIAHRTTQFSERGGIGLGRDQMIARSLANAPVAAPLGPAQRELWIRRSLMVTDQVILTDHSSGTIAPPFTMRAVLHQLATQAGTGQTEDQMFRQLWDVLNAAPGRASDQGANTAPHCSDNRNTLNGFPYFCRAAEGGQAASTSSITIDDYIPIGLVNRFDLAPTDGAHCGEYRAIFAKLPAAATSRSLLIFEAILPNPLPGMGLDGCLPVQQFWADLAKDNIPSSRAIKLRNFYFLGLPNFLPVFYFENYGMTGGQGQVRMNIFIQPDWNLREFRLQERPSCSAPPCTLTFLPVTDKVNPAPVLFGPVPGPGDPNFALAPLIAGFQADFLEQVPALAIQDINLFNFTVDDKYNIGQSDSQVDRYGIAPVPAPGAFKAAIQSALPGSAISAGITADDILARAETQSCAGCHQQSNDTILGGIDPQTGTAMKWPSSGTFVHVSELAVEQGPDGPRFVISPALRDVFLPRRLAVMRDFLAAAQSAQVPLWGNSTWNSAIWQ